jgi:hypothetical protein
MTFYRQIISALIVGFCLTSCKDKGQILRKKTSMIISPKNNSQVK